MNRLKSTEVEIWTYMDQNGLKWIELDRSVPNGPKWTELDSNRPNWTK